MYAVEQWRTTREEGSAALAYIWDHVLHLGQTPTDQERSSSESSSVGVRLSPSVFALTTPLLDDGDESDHGQFDQRLVYVPPSSDNESSVHLRMPPSGHTAAGTKRVQYEAGTVCPPFVTSWLVDSGCPLDLIDRTQVLGCLSSICDGSKVTLATANGDTTSSEVLPLFLNKLNEHVQPHVLDSTPNVLSLGRRVIVDGYSFEWPAYSYEPRLTHPTTGERIDLEVRDFVPYLVVPPNDAELREPWTHNSWAAAPSTRREAGSSGSGSLIADMERFHNAVDATPVARVANAAPGPGTGSSSSSSSSGGGGRGGSLPLAYRTMHH